MNTDEIIAFVRKRGPMLPVQLSKEIGQPILISSAILSELVDSKKLKLSYLKVGGSPLYYVPGDEEKLLNFLDHVNSKDKDTIALLKEEKLLEEEVQTPLVRVSLRQINDFAVPLDISYQGNTHRFWKWAFISNQEATTIMKKRVGMDPGTLPLRELPNKEAHLEKKHLKLEDLGKPQAKEQAPLEKPKEKLRSLHSHSRPKPSEGATETQQHLATKPTSDHFFSRVERYLKRNDIDIISADVVKKRFEIDLIVKLPSSVGRLTYYCKAKQKKRCTDSDLSAAYVQGELRKLPVLFLCTGDFTKKAKEMIQTAFKNMNIQTI
ncbi:MAG: hypothetical protein ABIH34_03805 [Nanoarchaeota archaeon]